jgi:phage tail-like protein
MRANTHNFRNVNVEGIWPEFKRRGLEISDDGSLQLASLPRLSAALPAAVADCEQQPYPGGIAVDIEGTIYYTDADNHRILRIGGCYTEESPLPCVGGYGDAPTRFNTLGGIVIPRDRRALYAVDIQNHRVQVFALDSGQLLDVWGELDSCGNAQATDRPRGFDTPWDIATDHDGALYVLDYGNSRIQKFTIGGDVQPGFWDNARSSGTLTDPVGITVAVNAGEPLVYVLDRARKAVVAFDVTGRVRAGVPASGRLPANILTSPGAIAVAGDSVYIGDNERRRIAVFRGSGSLQFMGAAVGFSGPVAAMLLDNSKKLLVHVGPAHRPLELEPHTGYTRRGFVWCEGIRPREIPVLWHRLKALIDRSSEAAHFQIYAAPSENTVPADGSVLLDGPFPATGEGWFDLDIGDVFIGGEPSEFLTFGLVFTGDGVSTPILSQVRAEFDHRGYIQDLPVIYRKNRESRIFLDRFLSLFESFLGEEEALADDLPRYFDPHAIPSEFLPWLAGWLALYYDESWDNDKMRRMIGAAYSKHARRGTASGLRESLYDHTGIRAIIEEPLLCTHWWGLPGTDNRCGTEATGSVKWVEREDSILGFTTVLLAGAPQGAVVGTTAVLDQSHLISNEEFGAPLFDEVAHQFSVNVYEGDVCCPETTEEIRAVLEREKPAHTTYHLCVIKPQMRVGFQARLGIDSVVAGPPRPTPLNDDDSASTELVLGGSPRGRLGNRSRVGQTTRV